MIRCVEAAARDAVEVLELMDVAVVRSEAVVQDQRPREVGGGQRSILRVGCLTGEGDQVADLPGQARRRRRDRRHRRRVARRIGGVQRVVDVADVPRPERVGRPRRVSTRVRVPAQVAERRVVAKLGQVGRRPRDVAHPDRSGRHRHRRREREVDPAPGSTGGDRNRVRHAQQRAGDTAGVRVHHGPDRLRARCGAQTRDVAGQLRHAARGGRGVLRHLLQVRGRRVGREAGRGRAERREPPPHRDGDRDRRARGGDAVVVGDPQDCVVRPGSGVRERRLLHRRVAERAVPVQIPRIRDRVPGIRIGRARPVEVDRQRRVPARRRRRRHRRRRVVLRRRPWNTSRRGSSACCWPSTSRTDSWGRTRSHRRSGCSAGRPRGCRTAAGSDRPYCLRCNPSRRCPRTPIRTSGR